MITFALVAYNQAKYIHQAVRSAFEQTYSPLQIILSDDKSNDGTWEAMCDLAKSYRGQNTLVLNQNAANTGLGAHVNKVMSLAHGELVVIAAGDDISRIDRTEQVVAAWNRSERKALSLTSHFKKIDEQGREIGEVRCQTSRASRKLLHRARYGCWNVQGCTHAWHRKVFEVFGPLQSYVIAEDRAIEFRSLALGEIATIDEFLVQYRVHGANLAAIRENATPADRMRNYSKVNQINSAMFAQFLVDLAQIESLGLYAPDQVIQARRLIGLNLSRLSMEREYLRSAKTRRLLLGLRALVQISPRIGLRWLWRFAN